MNNIKICMITDNNYAIPTAIAIVSMIENKDINSHYEINILATNLDDFNKNKLLELSGYNVSIKLIDVDNSRYNEIIAKTHVTTNALVKFDIANIFPTYEKILYLDGDIIVQKDLSEFYNQNINDYMVMSVRDMVAELNEKFHEIINVDKYFNSGVMLLNLTKIRNEKISEKLFQTKKNNPDWRCMDQDTFNFVFKNKIKWFDFKYNAMIPLCIEKEYSLEYVNEFYNMSYRSFYEMQEDAFIVHFAGEGHLRPWQIINGTMSDIWTRYYNLSPYKNIDLNRKVFIDDQINSLSMQVNSLTQQVNSLSNEIKILKDNTFKCYLEKILKIFKYSKYSYFDVNEFIELMVNKKKPKKYSINYIDKKKIEKEITKFNNFCLNKEKRDKRLIISLTSFPERMYDIHFALYSLLNQSIKPDEVILWLGLEQFPNKEKDVPKKVLKLKKNGLKIKWFKDIKSYKKLIPALIEYPNDIIITADDDIYYPYNWLGLLYGSYLKEPNYIHCHRAHRIVFDDKNEILPYEQWQFCIKNVEKSFLNFCTTGGGVLYPPNVLHRDVLNEELFLKLSPNADDIWFWAMAVLNKTKINVVKNNIQDLIYINPQRELGLNSEVTLSSSNNGKNGNNVQLQDLFSYFPELKNDVCFNYEKR